MQPDSSQPSSQEPATQIEPVRTFYPISLRFDLILYSHLFLGALGSFFPSGFPNKILCFCLSSTFHMPCPSHSPPFDHPNNEPLITQVFPVFCYLLPLTFLAPKTYTLHRRVQGSIPERRSVWVIILLQTCWTSFPPYAFRFSLLRRFHEKLKSRNLYLEFPANPPVINSAPKG